MRWLQICYVSLYNVYNKCMIYVLSADVYHYSMLMCKYASWVENPPDILN